MGQDPISPGPTRNPLSLSPYAIRIWIDLCVLCMRLVQALLRHIVLCARGGHPRTPQHYPCNDVGRHQKGLVSTSLFVASCAGGACSPGVGKGIERRVELTVGTAAWADASVQAFLGWTPVACWEGAYLEGSGKWKVENGL